MNNRRSGIRDRRTGGDVNAPERNTEIVRLYRAGRKQAEIARQFGMSQSRVSRVIYEAMQRERLRKLELGRA